MASANKPPLRTTVNLTNRTVEALESVTRLTDYSRTDVINRSVQIYAYLEGIWRDGGDVWVQEPGEEHPSKLKVL
ncbi:hypothetical protein [Streptomyces hygroscopicus]|uniref:hypothetical protein n=1 Tax=Streptomyces hygroscopicus TaxID=1912 RepID=UPI00223F18C3|nr:hypothetical protein [Streptomyces hygroscopicus]